MVDQQQHLVIFVMGVSGCGKTTIGTLLASTMKIEFYDGDDFHPQKNIEKMRSGHPLTDEDRWPWLQRMHDFAAHKINSSSIVMACSALKSSYRDVLSQGIEAHCRWVFLNGSYETILHRIQQRKDHYMPASLLQSQLNDLEIPADAISEDISLTPAEIVKDILQQLNKSGG